MVIKDRMGSAKLNSSTIRQSTSLLNRLQRFSSMKLSSNSNSKNPQSYSLGISIVQGTDNNVYVKDLVKNGPSEKHGVQIGDQVSDWDSQFLVET